jgi:serine/threonine protein kinase
LEREAWQVFFFGFDLNLQRPAAVKVIDERFQNESAYSERFLREARAMASWRHPNIPQVYQAGIEDGIYYYAMEYIHGMDLSKLLEQYTRQGVTLTHEDVLLIGHAVADALDYAHQKGAIHRDVKPSNVMVAEDDRILLMDFGLVLVKDMGTRGEVIGSPRYMSPEQASGSANVVTQSDLYSLGIMLYEMLVGVLPFEDPSPAVLALKHINQEPPPPRSINPYLHPEVEQVLLKTLRKNPGERFHTGNELITALERALKHQAESQNATQLNQSSYTIAAFRREDQSPVSLSTSSFRLAEVVARELPPPPGSSGATNHPSNIIGDSLPHSSPKSTIPGKVAATVQATSTRGPVSLLSLLGIGAAGVLAVLCIFLSFTIGAALLSNRDGFDPFNLAFRSTATVRVGTSPSTESPVGEAIPAPSTPTKTQVALTPTPTRTQLAITTTPTQTPAILTSTPLVGIRPTSTPPEQYFLKLVAKKDEFLYLINRGETKIPLSSLVLGKGKGEIEGTEWEVEFLMPGKCLAAVKEEGNPVTFRDSECSLVGDPIERSGSEKFWDSDYPVFFHDRQIGTCKKNKICLMRFTSSLPGQY